MSPRASLSIGVAAIILAAFCAGFFAEEIFITHGCTPGEHLELINPGLNCEPDYIIDKQPYIGLKHDLQDYIGAKQLSGEASEVSVYFRDLNNGPTLGINEHASFVPASLLKLPVFIAYLNYQSERPDLLSERIVLESLESDLDQVFASPSGLVAGNSYTVMELLYAMIVHSDNSALYRLEDYLHEIAPNQSIQLETYIDLGIIDPQDIYDDTLTTKSYSSIFLQLYHSSYFGQKSTSEQALKILSQTTFNEGIVSGVPRGTTVAHKFGERFFAESQVKQLHDCGIVYYPDNAYLLCVMTRGKDFTELATVIQEISAMVYAEFDSRRLP